MGMVFFYKRKMKIYVAVLQLTLCFGFFVL